MRGSAPRGAQAAALPFPRLCTCPRARRWPRAGQGAGVGGDSAGV